VLVAPVSRASIFAGKVLGGCTDVMIQVIVLLIIGSFIVMPLQALVLLKVILLLFLISVAMVSLGLSIGANMTSPEGFMLVVNSPSGRFSFLRPRFSRSKIFLHGFQ